MSADDDWIKRLAEDPSGDARLRARLADAKRREAHAIKRMHELEEALEVSLAIQAPRPVPKLQMPRKKGDSRRRATPWALFSDWHVEEQVLPEQVPGTNNSYDLKEAERRAKRAFHGVLDLVEHHRSRFDIQSLTLGLLGDLMTGRLREEDIEMGQLSPVETVLWLSDLLTWGIKLLLDEGKFEWIYLPCIHGNHGRTDPHTPNRARTGAKNSYEFLLYHALAKRIDDPRLRWDIAEGPRLYANTDGFITRVAHGDLGWKYNGGIQGIGVPLGKWIQRCDSIKRADQTCVGHWHQLGFQGRAVAVTNGSLIGPNGYSVALGHAEEAQQAFWLLDQKRGPCHMTPVWVT